MSHCLAKVSGQQRILDPISMFNFDVSSRIVHKHLAFAQPLDTFFCAVHFFLVSHILAQPWCLNCFGLVLGSDEPQSGRLEWKQGRRIEESRWGKFKSKIQRPQWWTVPWQVKYRASVSRSLAFSFGAWKPGPTAVPGAGSILAQQSVLRKTCEHLRTRWVYNYSGRSCQHIKAAWPAMCRWQISPNDLLHQTCQKALLLS